MHHFFKEDISLTMHAKWFHFSNADIAQPNNAINSILLLGGVSWFF
ncbi:MAG: acyloxyacyl hydrolase [Desulfobacterales bacterium]|jgi:hypothetical protein